MASWPPAVRAEQLAALHGDDDTCPGPWRVRRKLPSLLTTTAGHDLLDLLVVTTLMGHGELLADLARLCAEALRRSAGAGAATEAETVGVADTDKAAVKGLTTRVAASLAVALLESDLAERVETLLVEEAPFAEGWRACPE
jgi:hypothetical protein